MTAAAHRLPIERTVLAIDASLSGFAIALHIPGMPLFERELKTSPATSVRARIERYMKLADPAVELARQHQPALCVIEGYSFGSQDRGLRDIAELGGILRLKLLPHCDAVIECAPASLKKFATGKGNGKKAAVVSALAKRYDREFRTDNQADAFGLLQLGLCMLGCVEPDNQAQREAVAKVREQMEAT